MTQEQKTQMQNNETIMQIEKYDRNLINELDNLCLSELETLVSIINEKISIDCDYQYDSELIDLVD